MSAVDTNQLRHGKGGAIKAEDLREPEMSEPLLFDAQKYAHRQLEKYVLFLFREHGVQIVDAHFNWGEPGSFTGEIKSQMLPACMDGGNES